MYAFCEVFWEGFELINVYILTSQKITLVDYNSFYWETNDTLYVPNEISVCWTVNNSGIHLYTHVSLSNNDEMRSER